MPTVTILIETPECLVCHKSSTVTLTAIEFEAVTRVDEAGRPAVLIQDALPTRDADFRELVKSGIHPECWTSIFPDEEE